MTTELIANSPTPGTQAAITTLAAAITSTSATTITTAAASPTALQGGQFRIVIDSEIMIVTAGQTGTSWTVTRGAEGSTATTHSNGASVYHDLTAGALDARYLTLSGGTMAGAIAMGSGKITGIANGSASSDAAAFGQIPTASSTTPAMDGTGAAGTGTTWARADHVHPTDTSRAALASPTFTGTPAAPTAAVDTNTTQLATTAFVLGQTSTSTPAMDGVGAAGSSTRYARADHVHPTDTSRAPVASPTFTGTTTAPEFSASGLTGATAASRYVGATASGAPASGTFAVGDFVIDQTGFVWICTTAGTPGTWTKVGGGGSSGLTQVATTGSSGYALVNSTGTILTWTAPSDGNLHTVEIIGFMNVTSTTTGGAINVSVKIGGSTYTWTPLSAGKGAAIWNITGGANSANGNGLLAVIDPGSTISLTQNTAMTAGAATVYATMLSE